MVRKQLYLTPAQDRALKDRARRERLSEAALVRRAVDRLLEDDAPGRAALDDLDRVADAVAAAHPAERRAPSGGRGWTRDGLYEDRAARWVR